MKRKIAMLLSAVMIAGAMPMSAMAASTNSISKQVTVNSDTDLENAGKLTIKPTDYNGGIFYLTLANAEFNEEAVKKYNENLKFENESFDTIKATYSDLKSWAKAKKEANKTTVKNSIPHKLTYKNSTTVEVQMLSVDENLVGDTDTLKELFGTTVAPSATIELSTTTSDNKVISLVKSGSSGNMTVAIDGNSTGITEGTYTIGTIYSGSGSTTTTVSKVITFDGSQKLDTVTIKENVAGTFANGKTNFSEGDTITLRLTSGFVFDESKTKNDLRLVASRNISSTLTGKLSNVSIDGNTLVVKLTEAEAKALTIDKNLTSSLSIEGLYVEAADEDKNYGTVKLTVQGSNNTGITQETIEVATRQSQGLSMSLVNEAKTILAGRTYSVVNQSETSEYLSQEKFVTAKVKFGENYAGAWGESRLDFTVPEGVQITEVEITKVTNTGTAFSKTTLSATSNGSSHTSGNLSIINNGRTLRFAKGTKSGFTAGKAASFEMQFKLSVVAGYQGDITLSANGAGSSAGDIADLVIAKAIQPISVETSSTKLNVGYTNYSTADINIIENVPGALIAGQSLTLHIDSVLGEVAITDANVSVSGDELSISNTKNFIKTSSSSSSIKNSNGYIQLDIKNESYDKAATIKISNVKVGTTRSIPYGSYALKIGGKAIINNYDANYNSTSGTKANQNFAFNGSVSNYSVDDYVNVVTSTGTLDNTVKVTIGEKTVLVNDKAIDVDVAPYIQSSSNSTLVPLRFVTVALGLDGESVADADKSSKISFDANTKTATIYYGSGTTAKIIQFQAGSNIMNIGGTQIPMENGVVAEIKDGRMFVPFRALGQALGVNVSWDNDTRTAIYNANISSTTTSNVKNNSTSNTTTNNSTSNTTTNNSTTTNNTNTTTNANTTTNTTTNK